LWWVSQLPGSLSAFFSRSKVTSAAVSGEDNSAAIIAPTTSPRTPLEMRFRELVALDAYSAFLVNPSSLVK
jgi:hypothetical protein